MNTESSHSANYKIGRSVAFTENKGQITDQYLNKRSDILFVVQAEEMSVFFSKEGYSYQIESRSDNSSSTADGSDDLTIEKYRLDISWMNMKRECNLSSFDLLPELSNFHTVSQDEVYNVRSFGKLKYEDLYEGIDLLWYFKDGKMKYDIFLESGADYKDIKWEVQGAESITIDKKGRLVISTPLGDIVEDRPIANQANTGIDISWRIDGNTVGFEIGTYNPKLPLVIDPIVRRRWCSYFGGSDIDNAIDLVTDDSGNIFVLGTTLSSYNIATVGAYQTAIAGNGDAFLVKFDSSGSRIWSTYFGGTKTEDATACTIDRFGNIYITGRTKSSGLATTGAYQSIIVGNDFDAFIAKFSPSGARLWFTYFGGSGFDVGLGCAIDTLSNIYICGNTNSDSLISTSGSHQSTFGGYYDAFLAKFNSSGVIQWSTYIGGSDYDEATDCEIDSSGNVVIVGSTKSLNNISSSGAFQSALGGDTDILLARFSSSGVRIWSTYLGFVGGDKANACSIDKNNNLYVTGKGSSDSLYTSGTHSQIQGATFLIKFNITGNQVWGTGYGGSQYDQGLSCANDANGNIYLTGSTESTWGISTTGSHQILFGGISDAFIAKFNSSGILEWGTYFGGDEIDFGSGITIDSQNRLYIVGETRSDSNISTGGSFQSSFGGITDGFLLRMNECLPITVSIKDSSCFSYTSPSGKFTWYNSGIKTDFLTKSDGCDSILTIDLTIHKINNLVQVSGFDFKAEDSNSIYQWLKCDSGMTPITGETSSIFHAADSGSYAVEISKNGCIDTSNCYQTGKPNGLENYSYSNFKIYPNPNNGQFSFQSNLSGSSTLSVYSILGEVVFQSTFNVQRQNTIDLRGIIENGVYLMVIRNEDEVEKQKVFIVGE